MSARTSGAAVACRARRRSARRQVESHAPGACRDERAGMPPRPGADVEHPKAGAPGNGAPDQPNGALRVGVVAMGIEPEVLLTEPLLEPFRHVRYWLSAIGYPPVPRSLGAPGKPPSSSRAGG